jgi:hypothetical protein
MIRIGVLKCFALLLAMRWAGCDGAIFRVRRGFVRVSIYDRVWRVYGQWKDIPPLLSGEDEK